MMKTFSLKSQTALPNFPLKPVTKRIINKINAEDRRFHDWYRFVLSFPPHLVRTYLNDFEIGDKHTVLDPFCGTGTTIAECKLQGIRSVGVEALPFSHFVSSVKVDWSIEADRLRQYAEHIADNTLNELGKQEIDDDTDFEGDIHKLSLRTLDSNSKKLLIKDSISPIPLHKTLILLEKINKISEKLYYNHIVLALAKALVFSIGNLHFGPEVGVRKIKYDTPVISAWLSEVKKISNDLEMIKGQKYPDSDVLLGDSRCISQFIPSDSIDAVITSPPYPNEKDYTRTTRLESVLLGFIKDNSELRKSKKSLVRSNTRGVYKGDNDYKWINDNDDINQLADTIEQRRIELCKNSGFEKLYSTVTRLYFGGMAKHLFEISKILRPGAKLAYIVGDQASYFRVMIKTGDILAKIAQSIGYELLRIDLFRTRQSTSTKSGLREEVIVLRWNG